MKTIKIENGKAFYEGVEIENFAECQPLDGIHFKDEQYPLRWNYKDGTYPLPEGWDVVKEYWVKSYIKPYKFLETEFFHYRTVYEKWPERAKQTARLIKKEQNSAHGYTERSEIQAEEIRDKKHGCTEL